MDILELACSPIAEPCVNVGEEDYAPQARVQCRALRNQILRTFPVPEDVQAWLSTKGNQHDFGTYYEVVVHYDDQCEKATDYAFLLEASVPEYWDAEAVKELRAAGYRLALADR